MFSRYNGENGLIGAIRVWECNNKKGSEEYLRETRTCNQIVSQCKVGFHFLTLFFTFSIISTQKLLFSWGPGSVGEQLAVGTGIKVERGHYILLQVRVHKQQELICDLQVEYNPGTGFLTDDSGIVLQYHRKSGLRPVGRLLVTSALGQSTDHSQSTDHGQKYELGQTSVSPSTLCPSSCLSSQVENTSIV